MFVFRLFEEQVANAKLENMIVQAQLKSSAWTTLEPFLFAGSKNIDCSWLHQVGTLHSRDHQLADENGDHAQAHWTIPTSRHQLRN